MISQKVLSSNFTCFFELKISLKRLTYPAFAVFLSLNAFSQKTSEYLTMASDLKKKFSKDEIAAIENTDSHEYFVEASGALMVRQKSEANFIALKSNASLLLRTFSNNHVKTESYSLKNEKGRAQLHDKFCGSSVSDDIFYTDGQVCVYRSTISQVGQVVAYESTTLYNDPKYLTQVFFTEEYPSKKREISFIIPTNVEIELVEMNFAGYSIQKSNSKTNKGTLYTFILENSEAMPKESNQPGHLHFLPHILVLCKSYTTSKGEKVAILSSTADLYKWYASLTALLDTNYQTITSTVQELMKDKKSDEEKIRAIYYWVQDNIKYIAFEDGIAAFKPANAGEVFYNRYGDCKGMANLTKAMLQIAGFDARLTWIGTDKIPYSYSMPTLAVDNHMICTVILKGKQIILDATEKQNSLGDYAERIQGKEILIENGKDFVLSKVPVEPIDKYLEESDWKFNIVDKTLSGKGKTIWEGETKKNILYILQNLKVDDREKFLKRVIAGNANPDDFEKPIARGLKRDSILQIQTSANLKNQLYANDKDLYVDLDFEDDYGDAELKKDRKVPFKFTSRVFKKLRTELTVPSGYQLASVPEKLSIKSPYYEFEMGYQVSGNKIIYTKQIRILQKILPVNEFEKWNSTIQEVKSFYNNQLTLKTK